MRFATGIAPAHFLHHFLQHFLFKELRDLFVRVDGDDGGGSDAGKDLVALVSLLEII